MMTKVIATTTIIVLMFFNLLGNFWFTYGIWPRSWGSFTFFFFTGLVLHLMNTAVQAEKK